MADKSSYWELLKDPRWQRKRLEVMERDGFKCAECGATDKTLNVHHTYYAKGAAPWEYDCWSLRCLCDSCHKRIECTLSQVKFGLGVAQYLGELDLVHGFLLGLSAQCFERVQLESYSEAEGFGLAWGFDVWELKKLASADGWISMSAMYPGYSPANPFCASRSRALRSRQALPSPVSDQKSRALLRSHGWPGSCCDTTWTRTHG